MSETLQEEPGLPCERCGRFGAYRFDGAVLCMDCYQTSGSCCPEFGGDDLTKAADDEQQKRSRGG